MNSNWKRIKISELCDLIVDCVNKTAPSVEYTTPYKMLRTPNIKKGRVNTNDCRFVEKDTFEKWTRRAKVLKGDVLLTREAPMGEVGKVTSDEQLFLGQRIMQYRSNPTKLDPDFLLYSFLSPDLQYQFGRHNNTGSIVSHIRVPDCYEFEIFSPSIKEQKKIALVLSALDSKIELNNKINSELEAMAKTIYNYWFVQFDFPNAKGKPYKSNGGKMVWSEDLKREIPEGWEVKYLGDYAQIKKGVLITEKTANINGTFKVVSAGLDFSYYHSEANYPENTITISASGASAGFINFWREPIFACDCTTVRGKTTADTLQILGFLKMRQEFIYNQARGSAQPHVYPKDIEALLFPIPPSDLVEKYGKLVVAGNEKVAINLKENQQLASLRDWLLPMLMNGQVKVGNAEKMMEEKLSMAAEAKGVYKKSKVK